MTVTRRRTTLATAAAAALAITPAILGPGLSATFTDSESIRQTIGAVNLSAPGNNPGGTTTNPNDPGVNPDPGNGAGAVFLTAAREGRDCRLTWPTLANATIGLNLFRTTVNPLALLTADGNARIAGGIANYLDAEIGPSAQGYRMTATAGNWSAPLPTNADVTCEALRIYDNFNRTGNLDGSTTVAKAASGGKATGVLPWMSTGMATNGATANGPLDTLGLLNFGSANAVSQVLFNGAGNGARLITRANAAGTDYTQLRYAHTTEPKTISWTESRAQPDTLVSAGYQPASVTYRQCGSPVRVWSSEHSYHRGANWWNTSAEVIGDWATCQNGPYGATQTYPLAENQVVDYSATGCVAGRDYWSPGETCYKIHADKYADTAYTTTYTPPYVPPVYRATDPVVTSGSVTTISNIYRAFLEKIGSGAYSQMVFDKRQDDLTGVPTWCWNSNGLSCTVNQTTPTYSATPPSRFGLTANGGTIIASVDGNQMTTKTNSDTGTRHGIGAGAINPGLDEYTLALP